MERLVLKLALLEVPSPRFVSLIGMTRACRHVFVSQLPSHGFHSQVVISNKVGRIKHMRIMPGGALETDQDLAASGPTSVFVGRKLDDHRGSFLLEYPMDKGYVLDGRWDQMERIWEVRYFYR
jgi:hypothetical protein